MMPSDETRLQSAAVNCCDVQASRACVYGRLQHLIQIHMHGLVRSVGPVIIEPKRRCRTRLKIFDDEQGKREKQENIKIKTYSRRTPLTMLNTQFTGYRAQSTEVRPRSFLLQAPLVALGQIPMRSRSDLADLCGMTRKSIAYGCCKDILW